MLHVNTVEQRRVYRMSMIFMLMRQAVSISMIAGLLPEHVSIMPVYVLILGKRLVTSVVRLIVACNSLDRAFPLSRFFTGGGTIFADQAHKASDEQGDDSTARYPY